MWIKALFPLLIISVSSFSKTLCTKGEISYVYEKKTILEKKDFCVEKDKFILSKECVDDKCKELKEPASRPILLRKNPYSLGSIGFKVCRALGGQPQIIEFRLDPKKDWQQDSRCIFPSLEFVSNDILLNRWKGFILHNEKD